jgi:hypothetical protein
MTEFKYGSSNYNKKLSSTDRAGIAPTAANSNLVTTANKPASIDRPHPRLKKSFSECEYYDNGLEVNFNLSPSKSKSKKRVRLEPASINETIFADVGSAGGGKLQYNYDTSKSQYLLQQQQKLKEYKNDPNYLTNGDNYSSESSSTETRGILKNTKNSGLAEAHNKNSLKRNKGLSTLSLCSCDAETEVTMMANRSIYPPIFSPINPA